MRSGTALVIESRVAALMVDKVLFIFSSTILDYSEDFERELYGGQHACHKPCP